MSDIDCSTWASRMADRIGRVTGPLWTLLVFLAGLAYVIAREWAIWH